jgi:hypothetical protein
MKGEKRFSRAVIKKMQKSLPIHTFLKFCKKSRQKEAKTSSKKVKKG